MRSGAAEVGSGQTLNRQDGASRQQPVRRPRPFVLRSARGLLAALLVVVAAQGLLWAIFTGPLQGPDEAQHVAYVQAVAETGSGPSRDRGSGTYSTALAQTIYGLGLGPMLQHTGGRPYWDIAERQQMDVSALPRSAWTNGTGPNAVAQNPPLYYWMAAAAYHLSPSRSLLGRIFAVRVMTVGIYVATVALMWMLATDLFAHPWQRLLATGVVAFQPKLVAMGAVVNPDALLFACATGFFWMAVRTLRRGVTTRRMLAMSSFAGAGVLTHGRGLFLLGALAVCLVVMAIRERPRSFRAARPFALSIVALAPFILIAALWTRADSGGAAFGGEVAQQTTASGASLRQFLSYVFQFYFGPFSFLQPLGPAYGYRQVFIDTFFGGFASLEVNYTAQLTRSAANPGRFRPCSLRTHSRASLVVGRAEMVSVDHSGRLHRPSACPAAPIGISAT